MGNKLSDTHKRKLVEGRKKFMASRNGLICEVANGLSILADADNYIVRHGKRDFYLPSLETALADAQSILEKRNLLQAKQKELSGVVQAILDARSTIQEIMARLQTKIKRT